MKANTAIKNSVDITYPSYGTVTKTPHLSNVPVVPNFTKNLQSSSNPNKVQNKHELRNTQQPPNTFKVRKDFKEDWDIVEQNKDT